MGAVWRRSARLLLVTDGAVRRPGGGVPVLVQLDSQHGRRTDSCGVITMRKRARRLTLAETSPARSPEASNGSLSVLSLATNGRRALPPVCGSSRWMR
jgi:hypothetical protein